MPQVDLERVPQFYHKYIQLVTANDLGRSVDTAPANVSRCVAESTKRKVGL